MGEQLYFEDFPTGATRAFGRYELTRGQVEAYAATFDPLLGARRSATGAVSASPWQMPALLMRLNYDGWMNETAARGAPGVDESRWLRTLSCGESLSARFTVRNARVSRSKPDLGLVQFFYELLGGDQEPVLTQLNSVMIALRSPQPSGANTGADGAALNNHTGAAVDDAEAVSLGALDFPADEVVAFARTYDPQPFHVDPAAAKSGPFGALAASGWHTTAGWARAFAASVEAGTPGLPQPERLLWLRPLRWRKPVFAGSRVAYDYVPVGTETCANGEIITTAVGHGRDAGGATIFEFTLGMTVSA